MDQVSFKICFLNARSLHRHIDDVQFDLNYTSTDVNIFAETRFSRDNDDLYKIDNYTLFRNDANQSTTTRPYRGIAVYSHIEFIPSYPCAHNHNVVDITLMKMMNFPYVTIIGIYRSPKIPIKQLCCGLGEVLNMSTSYYNIIIGDFNINWLTECANSPFFDLLFNNYKYRQLITSFTTNN